MNSCCLLQVLLDNVVREVMLDHKVHLDFKVTKVHQDPLVSLDLKVPQDQKDSLDSKDQWDLPYVLILDLVSAIEFLYLIYLLIIVCNIIIIIINNDNNYNNNKLRYFNGFFLLYLQGSSGNDGMPGPMGERGAPVSKLCSIPRNIYSNDLFKFK